MHATVLETYTVQYPDPINVSAGARVIVDRRDDRFTHWLWCRGPDGREGWVPENILSSTEPGIAAVLEAYEATEAAVQAGDEVDVLREFDGFAWIQRGDGRLGWVPSKILKREND
jgi:SH3-like domain-containing protein